MTKQHRETLIWYRASHQEREKLLDFGLVDKSQYVTLLRQLRKKYAFRRKYDTRTSRKSKIKS